MEGHDLRNNGSGNFINDVRPDEEHATLMSSLSPPPSGRTIPSDMYIVQFPKDQVYRVPPSENARIVEQYRNPLKLKRKRNCCSCCSLRLMLTIALIIASTVAIIGVTLAVLFFIFNPTGPTFTVTDVAVIKRNGIGNNNSPLNYEVWLRAKNPNGRLGLEYVNNREDVFMMFEDTKVAAGKFPRLEQGQGDYSNVRVELVGSNGPLPDMMKRSMNDAKSNTNVELNLDMKLGVKIKAGGLKTWVMKSNVSCNFKLRGLGNDTSILSQECDTNFNQY